MAAGFPEHGGLGWESGLRLSFPTWRLEEQTPPFFPMLGPSLPSLRWDTGEVGGRVAAGEDILRPHTDLFVGSSIGIAMAVLVIKTWKYSKQLGE